MVMMLSLLRGGNPGRRVTNVPLVLPPAPSPRRPAYVNCNAQVYDSCLGPDSSVG
jgi:hypothetical protein